MPNIYNINCQFFLLLCFPHLVDNWLINLFNELYQLCPLGYNNFYFRSGYKPQTISNQSTNRINKPRFFPSYKKRKIRKCYILYIIHQYTSLRYTFIFTFYSDFYKRFFKWFIVVFCVTSNYKKKYENFKFLLLDLSSTWIIIILKGGVQNKKSYML